MPTDFAGTDQIVALAAARGMAVVPIVMYTPSWDAAPGLAADLALPRDNRPYGGYLTTLIERYGPRGSFWDQNPTLPRRPIRTREIWDEPDLRCFWPTPHWASGYVAPLGRAHAAVRHADPGARAILAGLTAYSWLDLASIYHVRGARRLFDVVEVHPYTKYPGGVVRILSFVRATMDKAGDRGEPMIAGETGWMSSLGQTPRLRTTKRPRAAKRAGSVRCCGCWPPTAPA